jgi:endonuclease/exonuclease/phosphatase family metal-dependent hydrolase
MNPRTFLRLALLFSTCFCAIVFSQQPDPIELRVMTFNIWYGGEQVSFAQTVEVIRAAQPDLVAVQEPDGNLRKLAAASGLSFIDEKRNLISRYPFFDPDTHDQPHHLYTRVLVRPGQIVAFASIHTTSSPSGPDMLREGKTVEEVLEVERGLRLREVQPYIKALNEIIGQGVPVFFAGDFNTPSHQDWPARKAAASVEWPVTKALSDAGFRDSYREVYPDAATKPGLTWTPGYPHPYRKKDEMQERIDMIWIAGAITALESKIIGEPNNPAVDLIVDPYPSDHRAVVSTVRVVPAIAPAMVIVEPLVVTQGSDFLVRFQTPDFGDWSLFVVPRGGDPVKDAIVSAKGPTVISTRPSMKFGSHKFGPGRYDAILTDANQKEIARTGFHVRATDAVPELRTEKSVYKQREAVKVFWRNAPGMKNDWIGIYRAKDPDLFTGYLAFVYTGTKVEGSAVLEETRNLESGDYELRLMREDSYVMLARTAFTIQARR